MGNNESHLAAGSRSTLRRVHSLPDTQQVQPGEASEVRSAYLVTCQTTTNMKNLLTTSGGAPIGEKTGSQTAGRRGPVLLQDFVLVDELAHFDRERVPERVLHAKGSGAHGFFKPTEDVSRFSKARLFELGKITSVFVRFSNALGESGSADTVRDCRGFAVKFFTEEGVWDLVAGNIPVFPIRDPSLLASFAHSQKRNPVTHLKDPDMAWDFLANRPETCHYLSMLYSDRGIPNGYRGINGYGVNTYKLVNQKGDVFWCKFHLKSEQRIHNLTTTEARILANTDPDYAGRDLYEAIERGDFPVWEMSIQVASAETDDNIDVDLFDATKTWSQQKYPLHPVGKLLLNRNPLNHFAEVEQAAFAPSNLIPGIEASPDRILQGRLFSYPDSQRYRLGPNYNQLPINCPLHVNNYHRGGRMNFKDKNNDGPNYFPNSLGGPDHHNAFRQTASKIAGCAGVGGGRDRTLAARTAVADEDNFSQVGRFWRNVLGDDGRRAVTENMAAQLRLVASPEIQKKICKNFDQCDTKFGEGLRAKLGMLKDKPNK